MFASLSACSLKSANSAFVADSRLNVRSQSAGVVKPFTLDIQAAHKKGAGSTKNGRDSNASRLGVKVYGGQPVKAGGIIVRQRGYSFHCGENTFVARDFTIHSKIDGVVRFKETKTARTIHVDIPVEQEVDRTADTRRMRRLAKYPPRNSSDDA
mmetsp:Transcript_13721/g.18844  ORF Transcript_13721/g.18844 Transcript_13721/m.18844 type:complete len:154 (+) Transcript_13721:249-710(+)|eukprot:CAMPEP_0196586242 /NCGR_PEP_ID=MMETSP1081-20130531/53606_1 /TAXON_ID=36882 /ORGANISM="Pyramimonas amylifera, Strain CCMP720" /LENGTH=153 /DNA_ID=CAMNT_0041908057 /DNA_START=238 /DNA_END=699 /DNA_ORIENTATION=+